jgi:hypothetical protein
MNSHVIGNHAEKSRMVESSVFGFWILFHDFFIKLRNVSKKATCWIEIGAFVTVNAVSV